MSWRPREIKDRLLHSGGDRFIRTVKNASRKVGAGTRGGRRARPGVDLHFRGLQEPSGELEAVLDDLEATSDPIFSTAAVGESERAPSSSPQQPKQRPTDQRGSGSGPREPLQTSARISDPLFPASDEEDGGGGRRLPRQATGPTDSEESEDLELDEAVAEEVLESLHLLAGGTERDELFDSESPPASKSAGGRGGRQESVGRQERKAVNNESSNNNTHFQEATAATAGTGHPEGVGSRPLQQAEPSLEELLERGSAALPSRTYSSSPHRLLGSPRAPLDAESSPSHLTSSNETDPLSLHQPLRPPTSSGRLRPVARHLGFEDKSQSSGDPGRVAQEQAVNEAGGLFPETVPRRPTSGHSRSPEKGSGSGDRNSPPTSSHTLNSSPLEEAKGKEVGQKISGKPCDDSDELFPDDARLPARSGMAERLKEAVEDDLFPDDSKLPQASEAPPKGRVTRNPDTNALDIREDHFSPSQEQKKKKLPHPHPPPRPFPPAPSSRSLAKLNSTGKTAPPRPPRSPLLDSRLRLRQQKERQSHPTSSHTPPSSRKLSHAREASEVSRVKTAPPLSSSLPSIRTTGTAEADTSQPNLGESLNKATSEPLEVTRVSSAALHSPQPSLGAADTDKPDSASDEASQEIDNVELPFLPLHVHLPLALLLYFYFTFNPFLYLAGLAAGFLLFYLCLGAAFVAYVQREEEEASLATDPGATEPFDSVKSSSVQLEDYEKRFIAPSSKNKFEFTATFSYDVATHHRRDRLQCRLKLVDDFNLHIRILKSEGGTIKKSFNLFKEKALITIVPEDVFQSRKRRWNKKYPIRLEVSGCEFFLFSNVSRFKQEWFFRLREAAQGTTTKQLVVRQGRFFRYMQQYFSNEPQARNSAFQTAPPPTSSAMTSSSGGSLSATTAAQRPATRHLSQRRQRAEVGAVQFSSTAAEDREEDVSEGSVSISSSHQPSRDHPPHSSIASTISSASSANEHPQRPSSARSLSSSSGVSLFPSTGGNLRLLESYWINALTARLFWDVWHEERWKKWIVTRIERKLVRIKTPRFLDPLQLTDIAIGESMPVINRLHEGPYLKVDGVWVFLDVEYEGEFVMTIKTRLKLSGGRKEEDEEEERGTEMKAMKRRSRLRHSQAAVMLQGVEPEDDSETESEEEEEEENGSSHSSLTNPLEEEEEEEVEGEGETDGKFAKPGTATVQSETQPAALKKRQRGARLKKVVSNITKRVANNRLVRRAAERAVERARSVPLELRVEVKKLKGVVAINIPPPTSDTIWYGFKSTPKLDLVARPKLGKRAVTFSQITHWIERKLCSIVDEKLTLPNMEDLVVPVLNSGLPEDTQKPLP